MTPKLKSLLKNRKLVWVNLILSALSIAFIVCLYITIKKNDLEIVRVQNAAKSDQEIYNIKLMVARERMRAAKKESDGSVN